MWRKSQRYQSRFSIKPLGPQGLTFETLETRQMLAADLGIPIGLLDLGAFHLTEMSAANSPLIPPSVAFSSADVNSMDSFKAIEFQEAPNQFGGVQLWRDFSLAGPKQDGQAIRLPSELTHAVFNPETETIFAITRHELYELNPATGQVSLLRFDADAATPSWLAGITYDSTRDRMVIATVQGHLYSWSADSSQWSVINDQDSGHGIVAMAYDAGTDSLWTLSGHGENALLTTLDSQGQATRTISLSGQFDMGLVDYHSASFQLTFENGELALVAISSGVDPATGMPAFAQEQFIFAIDSQSGHVELTSRIDLPGKQSNTNVLSPFAENLPAYQPPVGGEVDFQEFFDGVDGIHWVSLYSNDTDGRATVIVDRPGQTISLVLTSYDRVRWNIQATEGTVIKSVLIGGYESQSITGLEKGVDVVHATYFEGDLPNQRYLTAPGNIDTSEFDAAINDLYQLTGITVSSFQGQSGYVGPILVDHVSNDPRLSLGYQGKVDPATLPNYEFRGIEYVDEIAAGESYPSRKAYLVYYSLHGPDAEAIRVELPPRFVVSYTSNGQETYATPLGTDFVLIPGTDIVIASNRARVYQIDLTTGEYSELGLPENHSRQDSISGITYDSTRDRLIMAVDSNGNPAGGFLQAYSMHSQEWELITEYDRSMNIHAITYDADSDRIWALLDNEWDPQGDFVSFDAQGNVVQFLDLHGKLPADLIKYGTASNNPQLFVVDGKLIYVSSAVRFGQPETGIGTAFIFLVDPVDESVKLTWHSNESQVNERGIVNPGKNSPSPTPGTPSESTPTTEAPGAKTPGAKTPMPDASGKESSRAELTESETTREVRSTPKGVDPTMLVRSSRNEATVESQTSKRLQGSELPPHIGIAGILNKAVLDQVAIQSTEPTEGLDIAFADLILESFIGFLAETPDSVFDVALPASIESATDDVQLIDAPWQSLREEAELDLDEQIDRSAFPA